MGLPSLEDYLRFFLDAGIPAVTAQAYAQAFERNRIRTEMLPHLNKHLLNEMGINVLGDIFVILAHAADPNNILLCLSPSSNPTASDNSFRTAPTREITLYQPKKDFPKNYERQGPVPKSRKNNPLKPPSIINRLGDRYVNKNKVEDSMPRFDKRTWPREKIIGKSHSSFGSNDTPSFDSRKQRHSILSRLDQPGHKPSVFDRLD